MSMSSDNPRRATLEDAVVDEPKPTGRGKMAKALGLVGLVAVAAAVGFVAGQSQSSAAAPLTGTTDQVEEEAPETSVGKFEQATAKLREAVLVEGNEVLSTLTPQQMQDIVALYEQDKENWDHEFLSAELAEALWQYSQAETNGDVSRRLRDSRELIGEYDEELVDEAWERYEKETFPSPISTGADDIQITRDGDECWVVSSASEDFEDWIENLRVGSSDILAIEQTNERVEECGCERTTLWWCSTYKSCPVYRKLGEGWTGFIQNYNSIRLALKDAIVSQCNGANHVNLVGYSRGAGLLSPMALALRLDNVVSQEALRLITFGSPRVFEDEVSDVAHESFLTWRMVNSADIVASVPYDWWGYKHHGEMRCMDCSYPEGRDRPYFSVNVQAHLDYCYKFGDNVCP